jgi:hypothetical protein
MTMSNMTQRLKRKRTAENSASKTKHDHLSELPDAILFYYLMSFIGHDAVASLSFVSTTYTHLRVDPTRDMFFNKGRPLLMRLPFMVVSACVMNGTAIFGHGITDIYFKSEQYKRHSMSVSDAGWQDSTMQSDGADSGALSAMNQLVELERFLLEQVMKHEHILKREKAKARTLFVQTHPLHENDKVACDTFVCKYIKDHHLRSAVRDKNRFHNPNRDTRKYLYMNARMFHKRAPWNQNTDQQLQNLSSPLDVLERDYVRNMIPVYSALTNRRLTGNSAVIGGGDVVSPFVRISANVVADKIMLRLILQSVRLLKKGDNS